VTEGFEVSTLAPPERAFLVGVSLPGSSVARERDYLEELQQLALTAGAEVVGVTVQSRARLDGATFVGAGKVRLIRETCEELGANLVIFDHDLSPAQARNIEKIIGINVIDRTELILDIFARHAKTQQSKIQVELAQLQYALPRLTRLWDHLGRQVGGIGLRGPGETQLEVDRRRIYQRMAHLRRALKKVSRRRATLREGRNGLPTAALVGYTNAGKSTVMRRLTGADAFVRDRLFATLDTMTRRITTDNHGDILVIDTVGFIRRLPDHLVTSFQATLEDTAQAGLYLHVVDVSHPAYEEQMEITDATVASIDNNGVETLYVFNKIDRLLGDELEGLRERYPGGVFISAKHDEGMDDLRAAIERFFFGRNLRVEVKIAAGDGQGIARLHRLLHEASGAYEDDVFVMNGTIESGRMGQLENVSGARIRYLF
jgi:GTP-binding protein HflX